MSRQGSGALRFAVLTDTHVSFTDRVANREALRAAVAEIDADESLAFAVFSGDLTVNGATEDVKLGHEILGRMKKPCFAIPGNHESCWSDNQCRTWKELFGDWHFAADFGKYRLIGLRTGPFMHMAPARVDAHELEFLRREFAALAPGREVILVVHEPIDDGISNWRDFAAALDPGRVALCVGGHLHCNKLVELCGIPDLIFRAAASKKLEYAPGYSIVEIDDRRIRGFNRETGIKTVLAFDLDRRDGRWKLQAAKYFPAAPAPVRNPENLRRLCSAGTTVYAGALPLGDGKIVLGDADGKVTAFDPVSGGALWQNELGAAVFGDLAEHDGVVAAGTLGGEVSGISGATGETLWKLRLDTPVTGDVFFYRDGFFTGDAAGRFYKLDPRSGKVLFRTQLAGQRLQARGAAADGVICIGAWDGCLYAADAADGHELWRWRSERNYRFYSPGDAGVAVRGDKVYFALPDRWIRALDRATGRELWASDNAMVREAFSLAADGEKFLGKTLDGKLAVIPPDGSMPELVDLEIPGKLGCGVPSGQGMRLWGGVIEQGVRRKEVSSLPPAEWNGIYWLGSDGGALRGVDKRTLRIVFRGDIGGEVRGFAVAADGETLFATAIDGSLWTIRRK